MPTSANNLLPYSLCDLFYKFAHAEDQVWSIDTSQYRLLSGFFLLFTDRVPFELLDNAAIL
jgi:hypothetical protein